MTKSRESLAGGVLRAGLFAGSRLGAGPELSELDDQGVPLRQLLLQLRNFGLELANTITFVGLPDLILLSCESIVFICKLVKGFLYVLDVVP